MNIDRAIAIGLAAATLCFVDCRSAFAQEQTGASSADSDLSQAAETNGGQNARSSQQPSGVPQFQTTTEEASDAGLLPTLNSPAASDDGQATQQTANGFVPTLPGLTSYGAQAASNAAQAPKFLSANATQAVAFSDNPGLLSPGQFGVNNQLLARFNQPDFYETTSGGALVSKKIGLQTFFASGNFSVVNYAHDTNLNTTRYNLSAGQNYVLADTCTGTVVANQSQSATPLELTTGSLSPQNTQNTSIEVSSRCKTIGYVYTTSDVRLTRQAFTNSSTIGSLNNSDQLYGSGGLEYALPSFVTAGLMSSIQQTQFTNRDNASGLANQTSQITFDAYASKAISRKLNLQVSGGVTDLTTGSPSFGGTIEPIYSATLMYTYSPKTSLAASFTHLVGSPQSFVADFQQIETLAASLAYRLTPKITVTAGVNRSSTSSPGGFASIEDPVLSSAINSKSLSERAQISYNATRDVSAALSYQHVNRSYQMSVAANANIVSLSVSYRR